MSASGRNSARRIQNKNQRANEAQMNKREVADSVRESRQGYRGTAMFQLTKYYAQEGLLVVNLGGPAVVGR